MHLMLVLHLFLHTPQLLLSLLSFVQEGKFFECAVRGLWEEEPHEYDFEEEEDAVTDVIFPSSVTNSNGIDELVEETCTAREPLEHRETLGADVVRE
jgi:hypothetical protein